jgi:Zn-dependent protease with chaperone function
MPHTIQRLLAFILVCLLLAACATSPTGRRQLMLVSEDMAISSSAQAYVQEVGKLKKEGKLSDDRALIRRVDDITGKLVAQAVAMRPDSADWKWSVAVIDDPETVNAWCMAGGRMAIYTGLVQKIDPSDDELAQVMGHEIGHALANHTAEKMSVAMASSIGVMAVGVAADNKGAAVAGAAAAAALAVTLPNSRTAETEADRIGIELEQPAGRTAAAVPEHPSEPRKPRKGPGRAGPADGALLHGRCPPAEPSGSVGHRAGLRSPAPRRLNFLSWLLYSS